MERLVIIAWGDYPSPELIESLMASIGAHMKAYGLVNITVGREAPTQEHALRAALQWLVERADPTGPASAAALENARTLLKANPTRGSESKCLP